MTKVVISACYGGFGLSHTATLRYNELKGRPCYTFTHDIDGPYVPYEGDDQSRPFPLLYYFDVPNPEEVLRREDNWRDMTLDQRKASNSIYEQHDVGTRDIPRDDADLIKIVEEMGEDASGWAANLVVKEIPDGVEWQVEEYDGNEWVAEAHETWR